MTDKATTREACVSKNEEDFYNKDKIKNEDDLWNEVSVKWLIQPENKDNFKKVEFRIAEVFWGRKILVFAYTFPNLRGVSK